MSDIVRELDRLDHLIEIKEEQHRRIVDTASRLIENGADFNVLKDVEDQILRDLNELRKRRNELLKIYIEKYLKRHRKS